MCFARGALRSRFVVAGIPLSDITYGYAVAFAEVDLDEGILTKTVGW